MSKKIEEEFKNSRPFIDWLVRWRIVFKIEEDTKADYNLAYLIHKVYLNNKFKWQRILREIEKKALKYEPDQRIGFFNLMSLQQQKKALLLDFKSKKKDLYRKKLELADFAVEDAEKMITGENTPYWHAVNAKDLPDWYFVAKSSNPLFTRLYKNKPLPLEKRGEELDAEEYYDIAKFKKLFQGKTGDLKVYDASIKPFVDKLEKLLNEEIKIREDLIKVSDIDKVIDFYSKILAKIDEQKEIWKSLEPVLDQNLPKLSADIQDQCKDLYNVIMLVIEDHA